MSEPTLQFFSASRESMALEPLLAQLDLYHRLVGKLPFPPDRIKQVEEEDLYEAVVASAAIAGIQVSGEEIRQLDLDHIAESRQRLLVANQLLATYRFLATVEPSAALPVSEQLVCSLHRYCTGKSSTAHQDPGCYRIKPATIRDHHGIPVYQPADHGQVVQLMRQFIRWVNSAEITALHPLLRAGLAHYHLCLIHPFSDGNGRVARILETLILGGAGMWHLGLVMTAQYQQYKEEYFQAFVQTQQVGDDRTPFLAFVTRMGVQGLRRIKQCKLAWIRQSTLEYYFHRLRQERSINERQHALLTLLMENDEIFRLRDLVEKAPFFPLYRRLSQQTARRDLTRLVALGLLRRDPGGGYRLHRNILLEG